MKLSVFLSGIALSLAAAIPLHAQESERQVPLLLEGIWENYNRYVVFDSGYINSNQQSIPQIVLRTFYQWYDDRAAETRFPVHLVYIGRHVIETFGPEEKTVLRIQEAPRHPEIIA